MFIVEYLCFVLFLLGAWCLMLDVFLVCARFVVCFNDYLLREK